MVQIGQVIGIGGGAAAAGRAADPKKNKKTHRMLTLLSSGSSIQTATSETQPPPPPTEQATQAPAASSASTTLAQDPKDQRSKGKKYAESITSRALRGLLEGSVLKSYGWYTNRDRTLRIVGGPRAAEVDGYLVIETDTFEPFRVVDEEGDTVATGNEVAPHEEGEKEEEQASKEQEEAVSDENNGAYPDEKPTAASWDKGEKNNKKEAGEGEGGGEGEQE